MKKIINYHSFLQEVNNLWSCDGSELGAVEFAHLPAPEVLDDDTLRAHTPLVVDHPTVQAPRLVETGYKQVISQQNPVILSLNLK